MKNIAKRTQVHKKSRNQGEERRKNGIINCARKVNNTLVQKTRKGGSREHKETRKQVG